MQIKYVKGIDLSPGEIEEAQKRFDQFSSQSNRRRGVHRYDFLLPSQILFLLLWKMQTCAEGAMRAFFAAEAMRDLPHQ